MRLRLIVLLALAALLAGCGGGKQSSAAKPCPGQAKAEQKLTADLAVLKRAGRIHVKDTLLGGKAANQATDAFLLDLAYAPIGNVAKNRWLDHAASFVAGSCQQCFQAFEAARPVPAIAHGGATPCPAAKS